METKAMTVLAPDFYKDFHCVAGDCRHNCCVHPWTITINKKNYKQLRTLREPKWLTEHLGSYIKRNDSSDDDGNYAVIVYKENGCAFQTEEGLCRLQAELGAEYLSATCRNYPRLDTVVSSSNLSYLHMEQSLTISCEEVARILLHKPAPIQFVATEQQYHPASLLTDKRHINNFINMDKRPMLLHYSLIRAVCIAVLQNRDYTMEQRLILLLVYLDKLAQAEQSDDTGSIDGIPAMTDTFTAAVDEHLYDKLFAATPIPAVTAVLTNLASIYTFAADTENSIIQRCNVGIDAVGYDVRMDSYRAFMGDRDYFLEHLLVNEFFGKALPFKGSYSIADCAQYLVSVYTIFRFMLGACLGEQHTLTEVEFIDFVAYFGKKVLHSSESFTRNIELLKINDMNTLAYMIAIVIG